ncbi:aldehyde dehydrogenase family protein [Candidatus Rariloculus sp.]|uniref:aldehyde dehydrogenase family protein n=1 Tax=Candidatus Rariloculus sp. TaxID=3101265 RepID=UPI003D0AEC0E
MATDKRNLYIGGNWVDAANGAEFPVYSPATGTVWSSVADASRADTQAAIDAAREAFPAWSSTPHSRRARIIHKVGDILEARAKELHEILVDEGGSWIGKGMFETYYSSGVFRAAAAAAYQVNGEMLPSEYGKVSLVVREPLGVVSVISPWNFPMILSSRGFAPALAVGNCVVLKPSEETPVAGGLVFAEMLEEAGVPPGVFNVVTCSRDNVAEVGDELISNPAVQGISFTGSTAVGRQVAAQAGGLLKKCCAELGGKDALIVLADADIERAVNAATFGSFMHNGQICMSVERVIVDSSIADEFTSKFVANTSKLNVGDPHELGNCIGPLINRKQLDKIRGQVDDAVTHGAQILCGGGNDGLFFEPTVLGNVNRDMRIFKEETFGPVAPVIVADGVDDAVDIANDSDYGLSAGIITRNEEQGLAVAGRLRTGMAHVNDCSVHDEPHVPFGGIGASGLGRHGGRQGIDTFTETRWITLERGGRQYPPPFLMNPG